MEKIYICEICNTTYCSIQSLSNHKRNYHNIEQDDKRYKNKNDNLYHCRYCENKYRHYSSRAKHEGKCKPIENTDIIGQNIQIKDENAKIKEENEKIKAERDNYKDKVIKLQDKLIRSTRLTSKTFKSVNKFLMERSYMNQSNNVNSLNTVNNNIQISNIGYEDILNVLTQYQKEQILNARLKSLDKLVEITHCGEYNQFKNIIITPYHIVFM